MRDNVYLPKYDTYLPLPLKTQKGRRARAAAAHFQFLQIEYRIPLTSN